MRVLCFLFFAACFFNKIQDWILEKGIYFLLNEPTHRISIEEGKGFFPFSYSFKKISIDDEKGTWLVLQNGNLDMDSFFSFKKIELQYLDIKKKPIMYNITDIPWDKIRSVLSSRETIKQLDFKRIDILNFKKINLTVQNQGKKRFLRSFFEKCRLQIDEKYEWKITSPFLYLKGKGIEVCRAYPSSYGVFDIAFEPKSKKISIKTDSLKAEAHLYALDNIKNILISWKDWTLKGNWKKTFQGILESKNYSFPCEFQPDLFWTIQAIINNEKLPSTIKPSKIKNVFSHDITIQDSIQWDDIKILYKNKNFFIKKNDSILAKGSWDKNSIKATFLDFFHLSYHQDILKIFLPHFDYGPLSVKNFRIENNKIFVEKISLNDLKIHNLSGKIDTQKFSVNLTSNECSLFFDLDHFYNLSIPAFKWKKEGDVLKIGKGIISYKNEKLILKRVPLKRLLFLKNYPDLKHASGSIGKEEGNIKMNQVFSVIWNKKGFTLKAPPSFALNGKWDQSFYASGSLDLVHLFLPFDIRGMALFNLKGAFNDYHGTIQLKNGVYENINNGVFVNKINGWLIGQGKWFLLKNLKAENVTGEGKISLTEADVILKLNEYAPVDTDSIYLKLKGNISVKGPWTNLLIGGAVDFLKGEILLDNLIAPNIPELQKKGKIVKKEIKIDKNQYTLVFDTKKDIKIEGLGLKSTWRGHLNVYGELLTPYFLGDLFLRSGKLTVFGKPMFLKEGKISYKAKDPNVPHIYLLAERDVKNIKIFLLIKGTAKNPKITLTSLPSYSEDVVLAYLLFEKDLKNAGVLEALQLAKILVAKEKNSLDFIKNLQNHLDFINIEIKEEEELTQGFENKKRNFVEISKEIGKIKIAASQELGSGKETRASVKYPLTPYLSADVGVARRSFNENGPTFGGDLGLEFQWRF